MGDWRCPFCQQVASPINVHGHVQCSSCGQNIDPCCGGETADCGTPAPDNAVGGDGAKSVPAYMIGGK
jgi:hypothetical protein